MTTILSGGRLRTALTAAALLAPLAPLAAQQAPVTKPVWPATRTEQIARGVAEVPKGSIFIRGLDSLWTANGQVLANVSVLVRDGVIRGIGPDLQPPAGVPVVEGRGLTAIPGLVDTHTHIAEATSNEGSAPVVAEVRVVDVLQPDDLGIYQALSGGVTTTVILHGSSNPIGGQAAVIKTRWGVDDGKQLLVEGAPRFIKFALGENVTRKGRNGGASGQARFPGSRQGVEALYVSAFTAAQDYRKAWQDYARDPGAHPVPPRRDLRLEALVDILDGRLRVIAHSYRSDEIVMLMDVAERFGFRIDLFTHVLEGYKVADEIREHGAGASTFSDWWQYKLEAYDAIPYAPAIMHQKGVLTSLNSDIPWLQGTMVMELNKPVKYGGVSREESLRMLTAYAAKQIHLDDRIGTLEVGKEGDVVLLNGDPFDSYSRVEKTIVDGIVYYDRAREAETRGEPVRVVADLVARAAAPQATAAPRATPQGDGVREGTGAGAAVPPSAGAAAVTAIVGATVHPVSGPAIPNGVVVIQDGKIAAVGPAASVTIPAGATRVDAAGRHVYPGMIEPMTQLGMIEIESWEAARDDAEIGRFNPHVKSLWGVHPHSEAIPVARANGVTAIMAAPTSGIIAGAGSVVQLAGDTPPRMRVSESAALVVDLPDAPGDAWSEAKLEGEQLLETVALLERATLHAEGSVVRDEATDHFDAQTRGNERILLDAMVPAVTGRMPVFFKARTQRDIETALLVLEKFPRLRGVIVGGDQAYRVADRLARRNVAVVVGSMLIPTLDRDDPITAGWENAARLHQAGVRVAFTTQYVPNTTDVRNLPYHAARAAAYGLPRDVALRAVTLTAAELVGQGATMGSIEPGKRADLIVTTGDPLQIVTQVERVFIGGEEQSMETRHTRLYEKFRNRK